MTDTHGVSPQIFARAGYSLLMTTTRPALSLVHSDMTTPRQITQEEAYRNLLAEIYAPTVYTPKRAPRKLTAV